MLMCFFLIQTTHTTIDAMASDDTTHTTTMKTALWSPKYDGSLEWWFVSKCKFKFLQLMVMPYGFYRHKRGNRLLSAYTWRQLRRIAIQFGKHARTNNLKLVLDRKVWTSIVEGEIWISMLCLLCNGKYGVKSVC